jgi:hypothetical protein
MTMNYRTPGPWTAVIDETDTYFPHVLIGYRAGLKYSDGSGSDESSRSAAHLTINVGLDPEYLADGFVGNTGRACVSNAYAIAAVPDLIAALEAAQRLFKEALPKFNWGTSCLDANAIRLLNEVPSQVDAVLKQVDR